MKAFAPKVFFDKACASLQKRQKASQDVTMRATRSAEKKIWPPQDVCKTGERGIMEKDHMLQDVCVYSTG